MGHRSMNRIILGVLEMGAVPSIDKGDGDQSKSREIRRRRPFRRHRNLRCAMFSLFTRSAEPAGRSSFSPPTARWRTRHRLAMTDGTTFWRSPFGRPDGRRRTRGDDPAAAGPTSTLGRHWQAALWPSPALVPRDPARRGPAEAPPLHRTADLPSLQTMNAPTLDPSARSDRPFGRWAGFPSSSRKIDDRTNSARSGDGGRFCRQRNLGCAIFSLFTRSAEPAGRSSFSTSAARQSGRRRHSCDVSGCHHSSHIRRRPACAPLHADRHR
jgi:hypothetical protein